MVSAEHEDLTRRAVSDPLAAIILARRSFFSDVWPANEAETALTIKKINLAAANLKVGMQVMPFVVIIVALLNSVWTPWPITALWASTTIFVWYFSWRIFQPLDVKAGKTYRRADVLRVLAATGGFVLVYGSQGFLFWHPEDPSNQMAVLLILLASSLASAITAAWLPLSLLQIIYYVGIATVLLTGTGTGINLALMALAMFFAMFMAGMVANLHAYSYRLLSLEDHKDALIEQLRASNKAKTEFLANMSHELRTPMNAILGFSEVIKDELMGPNHQPLYKSYAADIHASGSHLLGLINDILDLSKIEAGKLELNESLVDARDVVDETIRILSLRAASKGIALINDFPPGIKVWVDPSAVRQISLNLASNALKFTPAGGTVRWTVEATPAGFAFAIEDTGCGIRPEDIEKVFESFGQGRHDVASKEKGTGLGLPIVRGLARAHGGDVWMTSELGKGTKVIVTLDPARIRELPDTLRQAAA